jgi:Ca2+-binding EF-hand superfamily protein
LFRHLDINGSNSIDFDEFVNEFANISTDKAIKNIKKILVQGKIDPEYFFNKHSKMDRTNQKLTSSEFSNLLKEVQPNLIKREIYHVQKYFDRGNKGQVTKTDFLHVISSDFIE